MRLTRAGEYGVRCVIYLATRPMGQVVNRMEIAGAMDIPGQFLTKIAQQLAVAGIVEAVQGARGGLKLSRPPDLISLLEVVEAITGEIFLNDCVGHPGSCKNSGSCSVHRVWKQAREQLRETLGGKNFAQLVAEGNCFSGLIPVQPDKGAC